MSDLAGAFVDIAAEETVGLIAEAEGTLAAADAEAALGDAAGASNNLRGIAPRLASLAAGPFGVIGLVTISGILALASMYKVIGRAFAAIGHVGQSVTGLVYFAWDSILGTALTYAQQAGSFFAGLVQNNLTATAHNLQTNINNTWNQAYAWAQQAEAAGVSAAEYLATIARNAGVDAATAVQGNLNAVDNQLHENLGQIATNLQANINTVSNGLHSELSTTASALQNNLNVAQLGLTQALARTATALQSNLNAVDNNLSGQLERVVTPQLARLGQEVDTCLAPLCDTVTPQAKNLQRKGLQMQALEDLGLLALIIALMEECVHDPAGVAHEGETLAKDLATPVVSFVRDTVGI